MMSFNLNSKVRLSAGLILVSVLSLLLANRAVWGPDYIAYIKWAVVAASSDMFSVSADIISPCRVPFSQFNHGSGFLLAIPAFLAKLSLFSGVYAGSLVPGRLASVMFWLVFSHVVYEVSGRRRSLAMLSLGLGFFGTHLGFYSIRHGSESFMYVFMAMLLYLAIARSPVTYFNALASGCACAMCLIIRTESVLYVLPLALYILLRIWHSSGALQIRVLLAAVVFGPIAVAFCQIGLVNVMMTGSVFHPPYLFGDASFMSVDMSRPEFAALLFHPWHGLFVYHPFYLLLAVVVFSGAFFAIGRNVRTGVAQLCVVFLLNIYINASWYCWWFGTGTFGSRAFGTSAVLLVPAFAAVLRARLDKGQSIALLAGAGFVCSIWSFMLMVQGHTNFATYMELASSLMRSLPVFPVIFSLILAVSAGMVSVMRIKGRILFSCTSEYSNSPYVRFPSVMLMTLAVFYLSQRAGADGAFQSGHVFAGAIVSLVLVFFAEIAWFPQWLPRAIGVFVEYLQVCVFTLVCVMFAVMCINVVHDLSDGKKMAALTNKARVFDFDPNEAGDALIEYGMIKGFDDKKSALRGFILRKNTDCNE